MTLEQRFPERSKFVLYTSASQHKDDCERFPYESIPARVFLDTNVLNTLVKYGEQIFDREPISDRVDATLATDIEALKFVFAVSARANWSMFCSRKTLNEISAVKDQNFRSELLEYAQCFFQGLSEEDIRFAGDFSRRIVDSAFVKALPDRSDRELVGNAIAYGCDVFCTRDRATIIRKRELLRQIPIRILSPAEWWACIKPWAGLWC